MSANNENDLINIELIREDGDIKLNIKTSEDFEEFLKKNKKLVELENFCLLNEKREFYDGRLTTEISPEYDSANRDLFINNHLNLAILRVKNISKGTTFKINKLIPLKDIEIIIKKFITDFKQYYKDYVKKFELNATLTYKNGF